MELTVKEKMNALLTEQVRDMFDQYLAVTDQYETFKYTLRKAMEENGVDKWECDLFTVSLTKDTMTTKVQTDRMKQASIYIPDAETGELAEVNAYEYFTHRVPQKGKFTLKIREDKYGG